MFDCISWRNVSRENQRKTLSLSTTAAQRVEDTGGNISSQFKNKANDFEWFSSALNESTDVTGMQSLPVTGGVSAKFDVSKK